MKRDKPEAESSQSRGLPSFWQELRRRKVVRVAVTYLAVAWLLIEVTATVFPQLGMPEWAPTLVTLLFIVGFPITIILAWIFDVTPEGIKATKSIDEEGVSENQQQRSNWISLVLAAGIPTLIFGALAVFFYLQSGSSAPSSLASNPAPQQVEDLEKSIAVLPLVNMSPDPDNAFFADGVQEEILTNLAKIHDLLVIGRTSTLRYRDTTKGLGEIGQELNVKYLLEGSVQRAGDQVRVTVQLIQTDTEGHLWAESYTRELDDFFSIISSISKEIAGQLHTVLSPEEISEIERPPTENKLAYDYYLRGRQVGMVAAIPLIEKAVELDPDFYDAWFRLTLNRIITWRRGNRSDTALYEAAQQAFNEVKRLAPDSPYILALTSVMIYNESGDLETALEYELKAYEMDPRSLYNIGWRSLQLGRLADAQHYLEIQIRGNPNGVADRLMNAYLFRGYWEEARQIIRRIMDNYSGDPRGELEGQRNLIIVDYLEHGDNQAFYSANAALPVIVDPQYRAGWMNDNYKIRDALINREYSDALRGLEDPDPYPSFSMLDGTITESIGGRWRVRVEPLNLLKALIHFEKKEEELWNLETEKARAYLELIIEKDTFADPDNLSLLALCYALEGDRKQVELLIAEVREKTDQINYQFRFQAMCEVHFAMCYLILGDEENAIEILEDASKLHSPLFLNRELDLWFIFDRLRGNPRFEALLEE